MGGRKTRPQHWRAALNRKQISVALILAPVLLAAAPGFGQDEAVVEPPPNTGAIHFELGVDWTSAYFFRGLLQEDDGFIVQPWLEVGVKLYESDNAALGLVIGSWHSFHDRETGAASSDSFRDTWYEADLYAGLSLSTGPWSFGATYTIYTSPSNAFSTIDEILLDASLDDSELWGGGFALNPSVALAFETNDRGGSEDAYLEIGVAPGFDCILNDATTIAIEIPLTAGFSLDDYYIDSSGGDETFGYFDIGVDASLDLPIPARFGDYSLSAGVHCLFLGDAAEDVNNGSDCEVIASIGLAVTY
jgi:hypothetical protein